MRALTRFLMASMLVVLASTPAGAWVVNGTPMCIAPGDQLDLVAQSDRAGGAYLAWTDPRDGQYRIYALHVDTNGNPATGWPFNGLAVYASDQNQTQPRIAVGPTGALSVFWHDAIHGRATLRYATLTPAGALADSGALVQLSIGGNSEQNVAVDATGIPWVAWSPHGSGTSIQVWRKGWAGALEIGTADILDTGRPEMVSDGAGGMLLAWQSTLIGRVDLLHAHVLANGTLAPGSTPGGDSLCTAPGSQEAVVATSDGAGGLYCAWVDRRSGNPDLYATRVTASGAIAPGWTPNGTAVCTAANAQTDVHIALDSGGGLLLAWDDQRAAVGDDDVYAMALSSDGQRRSGFPADGLAIATGSTTQIMPALAAHPDGSATIAWAQLTGGTRGFDVNAVRISQHGNLSPGLNGTGACTFLNDQLQPIVVPGPGTDALVFWTDQRDAQNDLYGTRLTLAAPLAVGPEPDAGFAITRVWPLPARFGRVQVWLVLPDAIPATLALFDVAGRRVSSVQAFAGAGVHKVTLEAGAAPPGLYFVRATRANVEHTARVVFTR